ncbi:T9SS type A sorting domain-containing protein [bacterium]|nr:T9SS type A sorting domain-containing protein [bacterium]
MKTINYSPLFLPGTNKKSVIGSFTIFLAFLSLPFFSFAQMDTTSFVFEGKTRDYFVFRPKNYNQTSKMPVVFNLHGYLLHKDQQMNYSQMNLVADTAGFLVVYPEAISPGWNCGISGSPPNVNDVGFLSALIDTLAQHYHIDSQRIYSCGFSLGGFMSYRLACELNDRIAAIADVAGTMGTYFINNCAASEPTPVLLIHGIDDEIIPYNGANDWCSIPKVIEYWTNFNHCIQSDSISLPDLDTADGCTVEKMTYKDSSNNARVAFYKVINGGHTWPGGNEDYFLSHPLGPVGKLSGDINANEEIWNFFKNFKLAGTNEVKIDTRTPVGYELFQNYPNPFNSETKISYHLQRQSNVSLQIVSTLGRLVKTLVDKSQSAGNYSFCWNGKDELGRDMASGLYLFNFRTEAFIDSRKMLLLR